jgi:hypothetical protein
MRCGFAPPLWATMSSSLASVSARWEPRLSAAIAWISSTMIVVTLLNSSRDRAAVSRMYSDSGVVTSTCGGVRSMRARSAGVVSPVLTAVRIVSSAMPLSTARCINSPSGSSRFLRTSFVSAFSGET